MRLLYESGPPPNLKLKGPRLYLAWDFLLWGVDQVHHKCYTSRRNEEGVSMPTKNPRINVVLEKPLYESIRRMAKKEDVSLSLKIRDLVREALEAEEDAALAQFAEERERSFKRSRALTHKRVWGS